MSRDSARANQEQGNRVFIVHGHDEHALQDVKEFVSSLGLTPIILAQQAGRGRTIIERIEEFRDVQYAVILYTPCDKGKAIKRERTYKKRARQNVVFEHGFFTGVLGRENVAVLLKTGVQKPSDIDGVLYIPFGANNHWKTKLEQELKAALLIQD